MSITLDDIYFMGILSRQGEVVNLRGEGRLEGALSVQDYIDMYCEDGAEKVVSQIPIARI